MRKGLISKEQARVFVSSLCMKEILAYADANREAYERFLTEQAQAREPPAVKNTHEGDMVVPQIKNKQ